MAGGESVEVDLDALHTATQRLMAAETEQEICTVAVTSVPDIFDGVLAGLWLYDADATELQLTAATDLADKVLGGDVVYRPGNSISWEAFDQGEVRTYSGTDSAEQKYNEDSRIKSELILPLGEHGVMNVGSLQPDPFQPTEIEVGRILATNVEGALSRAEREHELRVKNDRLEEFIGVISHDLRNPMNVAAGYLEHMQADIEDERLGKVSDAIDRIEMLIEDLLTLAEQGYVVENRTTLDLASLAERAWENVKTPEATLRVSGGTNIFGDEARLLQVFENLFRNSIEHGGDDVTVQVKAIETMHTSTRISTADHTDGFYVEDDGPGIPADERDHVFERGYSTSGTGLGLAIVKRIVDAHGWDISVKEAVGGGARFEITSGTKSVTPFETV